MGAYYLTFGLVFFFSFLADDFSKKTEKHNLPIQEQPVFTRLLLFLAAATFIFVAGCRYYVGTDFNAYYHGLTIYSNRLEESILKFDEPGLPIIATIVSWFTDDGAYFIFTCSLLTIGLFLITTYRNESSPLMTSLLFMFIVWYGTFNGVRQYLAAAILFCGHRFIYEKKIWKWLLTVLIATGVHTSAIIMFVLYFLLRNKVNLRNVLILAIGTYIVAANYDTIFSIISFIQETDRGTTSGYALRSVNALRILASCCPAIVCLVIWWNKDLTDEQTFYLNSLVIYGASMIAASGSAYLARIGIYTSPFAVVGLSKLFRLKNKTAEIVLRAGIVCLYAIFFYIEISGSSSLKNFRWIWERQVNRFGA